MAAPAPAFEIKVALDLENLIAKLSQELKQQKDMLDPKAMSLMRLYLSALRQYMNWTKNLNGVKENEPANKIPPRPACSILPQTHRSQTAQPAACSAPGLLMHFPEPAPGNGIHRDPQPPRIQSLREPVTISPCERSNVNERLRERKI